MDVKISTIQLHKYFSRLKGLMFKSNLEPQSFYHLKPCGSIHTFLMKVPIDVVFLSEDYHVLSIHRAVGPNRLLWQKGAKSVLESKVGLVDQHGLSIGKQVDLT